ncbi:sce7725 family protein [uncultured Clostridium sp.]|uniref:sce7725 family protein n=1 Tax=uncultured Clostridium sp. TaxID=59620 RepID=UPI00280ABA6D|nr:sce7725 family protein [uncultured Clostridium sp.]
MYFPYLRGRQYELLALRELLEKGLIGEKIIPIVEPVKLSLTFIKTIELFKEKGRSIVIIHNPMVGDFFKELGYPKNKNLKDLYNGMLKDSKIIKAHLINKKSKEQLEVLSKVGVTKSDIITINNKDLFSIYESEFKSNEAKYNLIPNENSFNHKIKKNKVIFSDKFNKLKRNNDYSENDNEFFSSEHLYYTMNDYIGFSDYSIIGKDFTDSGFAARAVAIHIVYFNEQQEMWVKHFVSDSNEDIKDPAKKYSEALEKLFEWESKTKTDTYAIKEFINQYKNGEYPGLGIPKKLAIMHHLELINRYLDSK